MATSTTDRRSGDPVDAAVPLSDLERDKSAGRLTDEAKCLEIRHRWQANIDASRDLRLRQWVRNVLMVYGEQDIHWSQRADRWLTVPMKRVRRYKTNQLPARLGNMAARMTQSAPEWTCLPYDDSVEAEQSAKACERLLRYDYREMRMDISRYIATIQMAIFGMGIIELYIDDEAEVEPEYEHELDATGAPVLSEFTGAPVRMLDPETGLEIIKGYSPKPKIKARPVSPFAFTPPPGLEWPNIDEAQYVIRAQFMSESYVRRRYGVKKDVPLTSDAYGNYESMTSYLWQSLNPQTLPVHRFESGRVLVLQYYERARDVKGYYKGKVYTVVGNHLVGDEPSLWDDGRYPFFVFPWLPVPDSFYPYPWLNPLVDPQSRLNQATTHLMDHLARVGSPNVIADKGSGFPSKPSFSYQVYFTQPGLRRPEFMQAPAMPTGALEMLAVTKKDMDDVASQYPLGRGESQRGITSGFHARVIQDADQTEMGPVVRMHSAEFARMGESLLELHRLHDREDRMMAIVGPGGEPELFNYRSTDVPVRQQVMVQEDSLLIHYRSALVEDANAKAASGAFGNMLMDPTARERYRRAVRDPHLDGPLTPEQAQKAYIDEVHHRLIHKGIVPQIEPWWDLQAHREAAQLRLLREGLRWPEPTKAKFMEFWQALEQAIAEVQAKQEQAQAEQAEKALRLQQEIETEGKAKIELQRGVNKLAVESMRGEQEVGAMSGAAIMRGAHTMMSDETAEGQSIAGRGNAREPGEGEK